MRPILYPPGTTDFTNLGVGKLRDTISAEVYEARNGAFTLEIEYPVNGVYFDQIKEFSYIKAKPNDRDDYHTFLVYEVAKSTTSRSVIVKATTKTDEIGNTLVTMTNTGNPQSLLNAMKTKALDPISYNMYSDISASKKVEWLRRNPLNALVGESGSLVDLFGGELKRTDSTIFLYQRRGNDKVAKFTARRGLKGAKIVLSTASIVTRILPYIKILGGAEEEDVTLTGTIVNSPLVNNYPVRPLVPVDFGMIDDSIDTLAKLNAKAATYFTSLYPEIDKPKVSIDLDLLSLQDTSDYAQFKAVEKIELCDTIDVYLPKYDVVRTVKVTELYYDSLREINTRIVAGDKSVSPIDAFKKEYSTQVDSLKNHLSKVENTMMVKGDGTQIWSGPDTPPPDKVNINDIWWKKTGEDKWALLIWNGLIWEDMLSDEIFKEIDIKIDQAEKDIAQNIIDIDAALDKATQAELDAGFSKDLAEEAKALGVTASSLAGEAKTNANKAMTDALEAIRQVGINEGVVADSSADSAEARRLAGLAEANAQEAKTNAGTAIADAEEALRQVALNGGVAADANAEAVEARRLAGLAEGNAQEALTKANTAVTDSSKALTDATKAFNKSFKSSTIAYATSTNGSTPPSTGWGTTVPTPSPDVYIWTRTTIVLNDNTPVVSYSVGKIGAKGDQGLKGDAGGQGIQGIPGVNAPTIKSVIQQFYLSTSKTTQTGGSWLSTVPVWSSGKYYWVRVVTTYSNDTTSTSTPVLDNALNDSLVTALEVKTANQNLSTTVTQHATLIEGKANSTTVDALTGRVTTAEGSISTIAGQVELKASTTDVNALTGRVTTAEGKITTQAGQIALKANSSDVDTLTGRVTTAEGNITTQAGQIALRATTATVNTLTGRVSTAEGKITTQAGLIELKASTEDVNTLTGRVSAAESSLSVQAGQIASKVSQTDFNALNGRVGTAESTITQQAGEIALRVTTTTYNAGIGSKENNITKATTAPAHLNGRLWLDTSVTPNVLKRSTGTAWVKVTPTTPGEVGAYSAGDGSALAGRVTTAETSITSNTTAINLRATKTDLDATKGRLTTAEGAIQVQAGQIALKASQTSVDNLTGRVGTAETNISANTTAINLRATKTSVDTLTGRVTTAEGKITTQAGQIALKANQSVVDTLTGRVTATEASIKVTDGKVTTLTTKTDGNTTSIGKLETSYTGLSSTVTQVKNNLEGMEIGGRNLFTNSGNFQNTTNWSGVNIAYEGGVPYLTGSGTLTNIADIPLEPGVEYVFTAKLRFNIAFPIASSTPNHIYVRYPGESAFSALDGATTLISNETQTIPGQWHVISLRFKTKPDTSKIPGLKFHAYTGTTPSVKDILWVKLEKGNKATDWTPAPEDVATVTQFSSLEQTVTGLKTTVGNKADQSQVTQLATSIELKANSTDVNALTGRVSTAEGKITTQAGQIALKANASTVNTLTGRVTTAEGNITTQAGLIALKANQSTVDTLTGRVSTTESKITATDGKVTTLTTKTDGHTTQIGTLQTGYNGLSSKVTALETGKVGTTAFSALEQNLSGFKTTVQNTYADKTTVTQLAGQWQTTTTLANGHTSQISSLGTAVNLRATKTEVAESILADKTIKDTRTTNQLPPWYYTNYPKQKAYEFKQCATIGLPTSAGTYASVVTEVPWAEASGGTIEQTATATDGVYQRRGTSTWSAWAKVADSSNIVSQINISPESILIASNKIQIKGDTYIENGVIKTAHIDSLNASKITAGTLNAANVNIINLNANNIVSGTFTGINYQNPFSFWYEGKNYSGTTLINHGGISQSASATDGTPASFVLTAGEVKTQIGNNITNIYPGRIRFTRGSGTESLLHYSTTEGVLYTSSYVGAGLGAYRVRNGVEEFKSLLITETDWAKYSAVVIRGNLKSPDINFTNGSFIYDNANKDLFVSAPRHLYLRTNGVSVIDLDPITSQIRTYLNIDMNYKNLWNVANITQTSDERLKTNITPTSKNGIEWTMKQRVIDYNWDGSNPINRNKPTTKQFGIIAQNAGEFSIVNEQTGYLSVSSLDLINIGIKTDQEIIKKINVLDVRLNATDSNVIQLVANDSLYGLRLNNLESEVFRLKKRIEELEKIA